MDRDHREPQQPLGREEHARAIERRKSVEEKLRQDVREMLEVLKVDVPAFFTRESKRRFLATPEVGEKMDDAALKRFKQDISTTGENVARDLARALEPWDAWAWDPRAPFPEDPKGLDSNPRVAAALGKIGGELAKLLERAGIPDAASAKDSYKLPTYFVAGRFMKSLVESYWRGLQEHVELSKIIDEVGSKERRDKLASRWDKA